MDLHPGRTEPATTAAPDKVVLRRKFLRSIFFTIGKFIYKNLYREGSEFIFVQQDADVRMCGCADVWIWGFGDLGICYQSISSGLSTG